MARPFTFLFIFLGGVAADLWSKSAVFASLAVGERTVVVPGRIFIAPTRNPGAMWSLFQDVPSWAWVVVRSSIAVGLFVYYWRHRPKPVWVHLAFGGVLAGAVGNVYDNIFAPGGMVRDFIAVVIPWVEYRFPTFNVADSMISVGAILLLLHFVRTPDDIPHRALSASTRPPRLDKDVP